MLHQSWEAYAMSLANASTDDELIAVLEDVVQKENIDLSSSSRVVVGRDTRPSGEALVNALVDGTEALGCQLTNDGLLTSNQVSYSASFALPDSMLQ